MRFRQVHLDFHTSEKIAGVGAKFDKKQFQDTLKLGHVDQITLFAKCHHGWSYYKSDANVMHPSLGGRELLREELAAAHEIGVKAPIYLSVGFDEKLVKDHPDWLRRERDGKLAVTPDFEVAGYHEFCLNTPYLSVVLDQVRDVCRTFLPQGLDGIFLDIVGERTCYCGFCNAALRAAGEDPADEQAHRALGRKVYKNYTDLIRRTVDEYGKEIPVFHNSGHISRGRRDLSDCDTHLELESLPTGGWGYDHFPLSARYVGQCGKEFLGMTGKFHRSWGEFGGFKHPNALRYEVSLAVANGAKCSIGDQLHPSGRLDPVTYELIGKAYGELESKEPWLDGVASVADVGLLSSEAVRAVRGVPQDKEVAHADAGAARILLEGHYLFDVCDTFSDFSKYKVLILPDDVTVDGEMKTKLSIFLQNGGKILATGTSALDCEEGDFVFDLGAEHVGACPFVPAYLRPAFTAECVGDTAYLIDTAAQNIRAREGAHVLAGIDAPYFNRTPEHFCSHRNTPASGEILCPAITEGQDGIYCAFPLFTEYATVGSLICKSVIVHLLDRLLGKEKTLSVTLGAQGICTLMKQAEHERYVLHLLYASPVRRGSGVEVIEDILPVYDTEVTLRLREPIARAVLVPEGTPIPLSKEGDLYRMTVPKIECHRMIALEIGK